MPLSKWLGTGSGPRGETEVRIGAENDLNPNPGRDRTSDNKHLVAANATTKLQHSLLLVISYDMQDTAG